MTLPLPSFTRSLLRAISLLLLLSTSLLTQGQTIRYVTQMGTGNGSSWADASGNLQAMINVSASDDQVWVAAGTYKPTTGTDRTISFAMKGGVTIYGGFVGTEANVSQRPTISLTTPSSTTLSGDIGAVGDRTDNSFHVIKNPAGLTSTAVLDGFVITGGNATDSGNQQDIGGGMLNVGNRNFSNQPQGQASSPSIRNCLFQANSATSGGAMYNDADAGIGNSSPTLTNCVFQANTASSNGGAIYNNGYNDNGTSPTLTNCTFQANTASSNGGAIYNDGHDRANSSPAFTNCFFQDNQASSGGAMYNDGHYYGGNSSPRLTNCSFQTNRASSKGGAINNDGSKSGTSSSTLINCSFRANSATSGGAIYNDADEGHSLGGSSPSLTNCWFQTNTASSTGGAIHNLSTYEGTITVLLTNCTFQANSAPQGGAIYGYGYGNGYVATSTLTNCVLFGNGGANTFYNAYTTVSATYSLLDASVTGYSGSTGNINVTVSPFVSTTGPTLSGCGPAINAGLNSATGLAGITTDLEGNPRIVGGRVDMGAVEFQGPAAITAQPVAGSAVCAGASVSVAVGVTGTVTAYQWYKNGSPVSGQTTATLLLSAATTTDAGSYSLALIGSCNSLTSSAFTLVVNPAQARLYVKAGASGANTGLSWADAFPDLQSALNYPCLGSASGTPTAEIWVAAGVYKPTSTTNRSLSFAMRNGVTIYGGFVGNETALSQRVLSNPLTTTLSGDIGASGVNTDNSYHVINNPTGLTNSAVLDGFLITGGNANGSTSPDDTGGGMINNGSGTANTCSPLLRDCLFQNNTAANGGGALYNAGYTGGNSSPGLINCAFQNNSAASRGGAIYNDGSIGGISNPRLTNCSFQANSAPSGGAVYSVGYQGASRPYLTNGVVWGNGGASTFFNGPGASISTSYSLFESSVMGYNAGSGSLTTTTSPFASTTSTLLRCGSTAIDAGDPATTSATVGSIDLAGNNRFYANGRIDMGAYEAQGASNTITTPGVSTATLGVAFSQSFTASGGTGPYTYSLASGSLPTGLGLANTGVVSGTPTQLGSFTLTAMGRDAVGCSGVSAAYVLTVVNANPTLTGLAVSPGAVCVGRAATFTATVGNLTGSYSYTLTNGVSAPLTGSASSSPFSQSVTASGTGPQTFTLTVSANGRSASSVTTLTVNPSPVATLASSGTLSCANSSVTLTAGGGNSYTFASGSGVVGTPGAANTVVVTTAGTYSVTVASASGCVSTTSTVVTADQVVPSISISPSSATLTCTSPTVSLSAIGSGSVRWNTGQNTPVISVSVAGPYSVTATGGNGCSAVASVGVIQDNSAPVASLVSSGMLSCAVTSVTLTASPSAQTYQFSTGAAQIGITNQARVSTTGTYSVTVTSANGCTAVASTTVTGDQTVPTAGLTNDGPLSCSKTSVTLTASGGGTYRFSTGATQIGEGNTARVSTTGTYSVTVTSANGCSAVASTTVSGDQTVPTVSLTNDGPLSCSKTSVTLTASGGGTYRFSTGATQIGEGNMARVSTTGTYSVTVTSANGCSAVASTSVSQDNTAPMASLVSSGTLSCSVTMVTLTASPSAQSYQFSAGAAQIGATNQAVVSSPGLYSVTLVYGNGCSSVASTSISQNNSAPSVTITASPSLAINQGQSTTLTANVSGGIAPFTYGWSTGATTSTIVVNMSGPYSVTATGANGCSGSASTTVTVSGPFAITGVTTVSCDPIQPNRFSVSFNPRYQGLNGQPVSLSVTNELFPTTQPEPYTLQLYADNPTITLNAVQSGVSSSFVYHWLAACNSSTSPNTPPRMVMGIPSQTATVGTYVSYVIPDGTFTDDQTPGSLKLSAAGVPAGLSFSGATLSGIPSTTVGSPVSITITATDPGGLWASTPLVLTVQPASGTPPPTMPFAITGVTTISCTPVANRININFAPRYAGMSGQSIAFEVVNELAPTTDPAPYSLTLYRDNPVITLRATQTGSPGPVSFPYNWLAACTSAGQENTPPRLNEPVNPQSATVGVGYSLNLNNTFTDQETPNQITLTSSALPAGLTLSGKMISGTPSMSGVTSVTLTATDGGGLSTSTSFTVTVSPASGTPTPPPSAAFSITGVTTVSCEVVSAGQRRLRFTPRYAGDSGSPISFSVVNELAPTTNPGPYTLSLYTDNPTIRLSAVQSGVSSQFSYGWLAACNASARQAAVEVPLSVTVLGNPAVGSHLRVDVRGAEGQPLHLQLTNASGALVNEQRVEQAATVERQTLELGRQPAGILLLRVSTPSQTRIVKVVQGE
jgi:predicted outer membrane repeat protein